MSNLHPDNFKAIMSHDDALLLVRTVFLMGGHAAQGITPKNPEDREALAAWEDMVLRAGVK